MSKISFTLNAFNKVTVYDLKHRPYRLHGGINNMELEYEDYVLLVKALGMTPMPNPDEAKPVEEQGIKETLAAEEPLHSEEPTDELKEDVPQINKHVTEESQFSDKSTNEVVNKNSGEVVKDQPAVEEPEKEDTVDYSTWSYTKLKNEYKRITGKSCKLKKEEVIAFLQEQ